ncbi:MAG: hypothetical protein AB7T19_13535 [Planctomycetota bacterium]
MQIASIRSVLVVVITLSSALAQRESAKLEFQKRSTSIAYGAVRVGKHSLDSLEIGGTWRLGNNEASTWRLDMPIVTNGAVLPPGEYRVNLVREANDRLALNLVGTRHALGGDRDLRVPGALSTNNKPSENLAIRLASATKPKKGAVQLDAQIAVDFGSSHWQAELALLSGEQNTKLGRGWTLEIFAVPGDLVTARGATPLAVGTLRKKPADDKSPQAWNLILAGDEARLVPWMTAPTEQFGFAEPTAPDSEWIRRGTIETPAAKAEDGKEATTSEQVPPLRLVAAVTKDGNFQIDLAAGEHAMQIRIEPPTRSKKSN